MYSKTRIALLFALIATSVGIFFNLGCRRAPAKKTLLYKSEIEALKRAELEKKSKGNLYSKRASSVYPWQEKKPRPNSIPESISCSQRDIESKINYIHEYMHGKKSKLRLRD